MEQKKIYELHGEHKEWLNKLAFYGDELKVMQHRIEEIAVKNNHHETMKHVEHFQNQIIIQKNNMDELKHSINEHESYLQKNINENPTAVDHRQVNDHPKMRDSFNSFEGNFNNIRKELNVFLSKIM